MFEKGYLVICLLTLGLYIQLTNGQDLLTVKCPFDDQGPPYRWSLEYGRCYQVVNYAHSYSKALSYCKKYGARLAEPVGYAVNTMVADLVTSKISNDTSYRIGYRYQSEQVNLATEGYWSDGRQATVDGGIWGRRQPDTGLGLCAYVNMPSRQWFMGSCDSLMPFVCEIDPCPAGEGDKDTFMCNGKCLGRSMVCDGTDDCGNNLDEQDCQTENKCTYTFTQNSGTLTLPTLDNSYKANQDCTWIIITDPGSRINVEFDGLFSLEEMADFLEVYDGDFARPSSQLALRLSGATSRNFISSYNFLGLRFVSDAKEQSSGFTLRWSTEYQCGQFEVLSGYTFANANIMYDEWSGSRVDEDRCRIKCIDDCYGFSYNEASHTCHFFNMLPMLQEDAGYDLHIKTCPSFTTIKGSVPVFADHLTAVSTAGQVATPFYPKVYPGNMELEYFITTRANNLITLQALTIDLCYGDYVYIYDGSHDLLTTLTSDSQPQYILSTGNRLYVRMVLEKHWKCHGVLLEYKQGCDLTFTGNGMIASPGFGTSKSYPPLMVCTWVINPPSQGRSITLKFDEFDLGDNDKLTLEPSGGSVSQFTGTDLRQQSITTQNTTTVTMETSSRGNGKGFSMSFSPGCPPLQSSEYVLDSDKFNYGNIVVVRCADGFYFTGIFKGRASVTIHCQLGGTWSEPELPVCARGYCGPAGSIDNGYVVSSTGVQGGQTTTYDCNDGFTMTNSAQIKCQANNDWWTKPTCTSAQCPAIDSTVTGPDSLIALGDGTSHGTVAQLQCPEQQDIIGAQTVQCNQGNWDFVDGQASYCKARDCGTPLIPNAMLLTAGPYIVGQNISVRCQEGYDLSGSAWFSCGPAADPPTCEARTCSLTDIPNLLTVTTTETSFPYGQQVLVQCVDGYEFTNAKTSMLTLTCLSSKAWDVTPSCQRRSCGKPYDVGGSSYSYTDQQCWDHGCSFTLSCRSRYELFGTSSSGDSIVRCGAVVPGLWDFGDLRCIGGQCVDPGYPASGYLIGSSFQEGSHVTFGCDSDEEFPINSDDTANTGITCVYDFATDTMVWDGEVPQCKDITPPVIVNCPPSNSVPVSSFHRLTIGNLEAPGFLVPYAEDNCGVKTFTRTPENVLPSQIRSSAEHWTYEATDYCGNTAACRVTITIPEFLECQNSESTNVQLESFYNSQQINTTSGHYVMIKEDYPGHVRVEGDISTITVTPDSSTLSLVQEVEVTAKDRQNGGILATCTLQFRFSAKGCANWPFERPNTVANCITSSCTVACETDYYFIDSPDSTSIIVDCVGGQWQRSPPICALSTENFVRFFVGYNYQYSVNSAIAADDVATCTATYEAQVSPVLDKFRQTMETRCNNIGQGSTDNPVILTFDNYILSIETGTILTRLTVRFEFIIDVTDESAASTQTIKQNCASAILSVLNTPGTNPVGGINGDQNLGCGAGLFYQAGQTESSQYRCLDGRKFFNNNGNRLCLECPAGTYYDSVENNCMDCPSGTYWDGSSCQSCPNGENNGLTGLINVDDCSKKAICPMGTYSDTGLAPCTPCPRNFYNHFPAGSTCSECLTGEITELEGSTSQTECLDQTEADLQGVTTPCTDNPCQFGGTCSIVRHDALCTCPPDYTGTACETRITACVSNPCKNNQACYDYDQRDTYTCQCQLDPKPDNELNGTNCEIDVFGCSIDACANNGTCHNMRGESSCKCPTHGGFKNVSRICETPIDQCTDNPCVHGSCVAHGSYYRSCDCDPGYEGQDCSKNIDDCSPNPCQNGAACTDGVNTFLCECADGYHGNLCQFRRACEQDCAGGTSVYCHTCSIDGTDSCTNYGNSYICNCLANYTGLSCDVEISPCNNYPCRGGGTCVQLSVTQYRCDCLSPWTGTNCESQVNNCPDGNQCFNGGTCYSTPSGYRCRCPYKFIGDSCSVAYDLCDRANPCLNGGECSVDEVGIQCNCPQGYEGDYCEIVLPTCDPSSCANGGTCDDSSGEIHCSCVSGFTGPTCEVNVDDCTENSCTQFQECVDGVDDFSCICALGRWGQNCEKEVGANFDYIVQPQLMGRAEASSVVFGDGTTPITALSVSFWARYTHVMGDAVLMNVYGSNTGDTAIPESPIFKLVFERAKVTSLLEGSGTRRRKRATRDLSYGLGVDIADGYWHHMAVAWENADPAEINLYVDGQFQDQQVFGQGENLGTNGFLVFGAYNPVTGTSDPDNSFHGLVSQLYILDYKLDDAAVTDLYESYSTVNLANILRHEATLMLLYPVVYNSELTTGHCLPNDNSCQRLNTGATVPSVTSCPADTMTLTTRGGEPTWPLPTFSGTVPGSIASNYETNATAMDWGAYGIISAEFDTSGSAAVCVFRLYNYQELPCSMENTNPAPSSVNAASGKRYSPNCGSGQAVVGDVPVYQVCNMYSMWNKEIEYNYRYVYPVCSAASTLTNSVQVNLNVQLTEGSCTTSFLSAYRSSILPLMTALNLDLDGKLCPLNCIQPLTDALACAGSDTVSISINFGRLEASMTYEGSTITVDQAVQLAVGDRQVFHYERTGVQAGPVLRSLAVVSIPSCEEGMEATSDSCVSCGAGTRYTSDGLCERCGQGSYRSSASSNYNACENCHDSSTTISDGSIASSFCKAICQPGQYNANSVCRACPEGFYQETVGAFYCRACPNALTTAGQGTRAADLCVSPGSLITTTTTSGPGPQVGAATEDSSLSVGLIVAVVMAVLIVLTIVLLIVCFCCCRDIMPCFKKQKQIVAPTSKEGYYADKYGEPRMQFVSYNLRDVREKKGRPLDRVPIVDNPLSDETGSVKTDISVHVPVFTEKMDGKVTRKSLYISNGVTNLNSSRTRSFISSHEPTPRTYEQPITSSPRGTHYDEVHEVPDDRKHRSKRRRRRHKKDRSGERAYRSAERPHRHTDGGERSRRSYPADQPEGDYDEIPMAQAPAHLPKALAPMPHRIKSMPPSDIHLRPLSPLDRPKPKVEPNEYQDFLVGSPKKSQHRSNFMSGQFDDDVDDDIRVTPVHRIEVESDPEDWR